MFSLLTHQVLWEIMKCTKFIGKRKYLFYVTVKEIIQIWLKPEFFSLSIEWFNFQVEIRMCIISYKYNLISLSAE
jgi:hypothetical protein